ncbi:MAG: hypothetical protein ACSHX0_10390 [Akkermansiaceae bacterium]
MKMPNPTLIAIAFVALTSCAENLPTGSSNTSATVSPTTKAMSKIPLGIRPESGSNDLIISPYKPYNLIDVKGFKSGQVVGDPSTISTDPKTGQAIPSSIQTFRIP